MWMELLAFSTAGLLFLLLMALQADFKPPQLVLRTCEELWGFSQRKGERQFVVSEKSAVALSKRCGIPLWRRE